VSQLSVPHPIAFYQQIDTKFPVSDKSSDGTLGDAASVPATNAAEPAPRPSASDRLLCLVRQALADRSVGERQLNSSLLWFAMIPTGMRGSHELNINAD
jgi:hypothetical protein